MKKRADNAAELGAKFRAADPDGAGVRRVIAAYVQHATPKQLVEMNNAAHRGAKFTTGRRKGTPNNTTPRIEAQVDKLYAKNSGLSAEEVRTLKAPKNLKSLSRSTFAERWKKAKARAANNVRK